MDFTDPRKSQAQRSDQPSTSNYTDTKPSSVNDSAHIERLAPVHTYVEKNETTEITHVHHEYLMQRHGTVELDPVPNMGGTDPYNWPAWKKIINLSLVAFHAMMATFSAAAIQSAFIPIAADLGVSLTRASYLTSLFIAILGWAPLFWRPLSNRYGRRPIFLFSLICSLVGNIGCAKSPSYATMGICRAITAFFISPAGAIGPAVVVETFFKKDRARYMGIWTLMVTLGVPVASFVFGFVANDVGYRWIYYILAIINGVQLVLYFFLGPETRYMRRGVQHTGSELKQEFFNFKRIDPKPLTWWDFVQPFTFFTRACVFIPAAAYSMIFLFGSILISIEIPQLFGAKFHFDAQQLGLQFIGMIVGSIIGAELGGSLSDFWMNRRKRKTEVTPKPEFRLWLSHPGYLLTICGVVVFLVRIEQAPPLQWNVTPIIGAAIAAVGNQVVTTILVTYAVDCYREEAASVGVFITLVRQTWGFIGPFWFPPMFTKVGLLGSAGVAVALMVGVSILPTIFLQWKGKDWRGRAVRA